MPIGQYMAMQVTQPVTNASGAIWWPNSELMQVELSDGKIWKLCTWSHVVAKFVTNASSAIWWPIFQLMQVSPSGGKIWN